MKKILFTLFIFCLIGPISSVAAAPVSETTLTVLSRGHIQDLGDYPQDGSWVESPERIGTVGQSKRIEGFELKSGSELPAGYELRYNVHVQNIGWLYDEADPVTWAKNGDYAGTRGQGLRIEAVKIVLLDAADNKATDYHIRYQGHVQNIGDLPADSEKWYTDGEQLGTVGSSLRLEALKLEIIKDTPANNDLSSYNVLIKQIETLNEGDYSKTSWKNLQEILTKNKVTSESRQEAVDAAVASITDGIKRLENLTKATIYDKAGSYGPTSETETIKQDVMITSRDVTLQNLVIEGNLIIDEAVGDGNVTLNNVRVSGELRVRGGGQNSIHINGGDYSKIVVERTPDGKVRIVVANLQGVPVVLSENAAGETLILEGSFDSVTVQAPDVVIKTQGQTSIKTLVVMAGSQNANIDLGSATTVTNLVLSSQTKVTGSGTVEKAEVTADNVVFEKAPGSYAVDPDVVVPPVMPTPQSGGGGYTPPSKISLTVATVPAVTLSRIYNGTTATDVTSQALDATAITGIVAGDTVTVTATATYDSKNAGTGKAVTIIYSLSGTDAGKYNAPTKTMLSGGEIAKADLTLPAADVTKVYDGTVSASQTVIPTAGVMTGDTLSVTKVTTFDSAGVGTNKTGSYIYSLSEKDSGNYNVPAGSSFSSGEITAKAVKIIGTTVETTKNYNRSDVALIKNTGTSSDLISSDNVTITATAYYADKNAGSNKPIYVTYSLTGTNAANYQVAYENAQTLADHPGISFIKLTDTGIINKLQLMADNSGVVADKAYDGGTAATVSQLPQITGIISGDTVNLGYGAAFTDANAGANKPATITYQITSGSGSENYLPPMCSTNATITPKTVGINIDTTNITKEYDGNSQATVSTTFSEGSVLSNDDLSCTMTAIYKDSANKETTNAGTAKTVDYTINLTGNAKTNYCFNNNTNTLTGTINGGEITPKTLIVAPPEIKKSRIYDGTANLYDTKDAVIPQQYPVAPAKITGLVGSDSVDVTAVVTANGKDVGDYAVNITYILGGANGSNYRLMNQSSTVTITKIQLTVAAGNVPIVAATRKYNGSTATDITNKTVPVTGVIGSEDVAVTATATFADKNVGPAKPVTMTYSLTGAAAKNYLAPATDDTTQKATITSRTLGYANIKLETIKRAGEGSSVAITQAEIDPTTYTSGTDGTVNDDKSRLILSCSADYYDGDQKTAAVGTHAIKLTGTLTGDEAKNYVMLDAYTYPQSGEILAATAVISSTYEIVQLPAPSTPYGVWHAWNDTLKTLTSPAGVSDFKLFYTKSGTTFYGYGSDGIIYQSTDLSSWSTTGDSVTLTGGYQLIGIDNSHTPLAIDASGKIYYWYGGWSDSGIAINETVFNPTFYTDGANEYVVYRDSQYRVCKRSLDSSVVTEITATATSDPFQPTGFNQSLLAYNSNTLMLYAY